MDECGFIVATGTHQIKNEIISSSNYFSNVPVAQISINYPLYGLSESAGKTFSSDCYAQMICYLHKLSKSEYGCSLLKKLHKLLFRKKMLYMS